MTKHIGELPNKLVFVKWERKFLYIFRLST